MIALMIQNQAVRRIINMGRPTKNLTAPVAIRMRHDQRSRVNKLITSMSDKEKQELINLDREKFSHPEYVKQGRDANYTTVILRLALDEYLNRLRVGDQLELFP